MPELATAPTDPATAPTTDAEGLLNVSPQGTPPTTRLRDYKSAAEIVRNLILEDEPDRLDRVNEQALLDGQGPFIQSELDRAGQGWRQNNDWGGASSKSEQAQAPYGELFNGFTAELDNTIQGAARLEFQAKIAESWAILHSRIWREHAFQDLNLTRIAVNYGVAIANHEHPRDWRWRAGGLGEHYFPRPMQAYENGTNVHVVVREYRPDELWKWYNHPKAEEVGYNKEAIKKAMLACNAAGSNQSGFFEGLTNNIYGATYSQRAAVRIFTMRTIEMTDSGEMVSEVMGQSDGQGDDYIYKSKKPSVLWDNMADCFTLFTSGIGNGDLHSIKGLGRKLFNTSQTENQFINQMFDFARIYMSPMFESDDALAGQKLAAMTVGLFQLIPKGLKLVPATAAPNYVDSVLPLIQYAGQLGQQATGVYTPQMTPGTVEQTREEVLIKTANNSIVTSAAITLHQNAKERQYNSSLRRLQRKDWSPSDPGYKERKLWIEDLAQRGVPEDVIYHIRYIKPNRQVGGGSAAVGQMLLEKAGNLRGFLDPIGQKLLDEMVFTRLLGSDNAKTLIPEIGIMRITDQMRFAQDENSFFMLGVEKPVQQSDDHFNHATIHDAALPDINIGFANGTVKPPQMLGFLNNWIPHQRQHLQALGGNAQQAGPVAQFNANLNKAVMTQEHLTNQAQRQQNILAQQAQAQAEKEAQSGQGTPTSGVADTQQKLQARAAEAQQDLQIDAARGNLELQQSEQKHQQDMQHRDDKAKQDAALKDQQNAADLLDSSPARPDLPPAPAPR